MDGRNNKYEHRTYTDYRCPENGRRHGSGSNSSSCCHFPEKGGACAATEYR